MSKKNKPDTRGFVYSTDPNFSFEANDFSFECHDGILFISAEKNVNDPSEDTLLFRRSFSLPKEAATEGITGTVQNSRLHVAIPKVC